MSEETKIRTWTLVSSFEIIELRLRQEAEMEPNLNEMCTDELTLRSVNKRIKLATYPVLGE